MPQTSCTPSQPLRSLFKEENKKTKTVLTPLLPVSSNNSETNSSDSLDVPLSVPQSKHPEAKENTDPKNSLGLLTKHKLVTFLCLLVAFGGFVFGWDTGTISGFVQMSSFRETFGEHVSSTNTYEFSNTRVGLIISIFNLGCALGGVTLAKFGDVLGRKKGLIIVMVVYMAGIAVQISSFHWVQFLTGRIVAGLAVGAVSVLSPMFIAETSPSEIRGVLVSCYQLMITFGILLGYITTFGTVSSFSNSCQWRIPLGLCFVWASSMIAGMMFLPESPRFLIEKGKLEQAKNSIAKVLGQKNDHAVVLNEINVIAAAIDEQKQAGNASWKELIHGQPHILVRLLIGISLQSFQQLTGNNYFFYYGTSIFKSVGMENSFITSIALGSVNFGSTFIALYSIGRIGRRLNLVAGAAMMSACLLCFSTIGSTVLYPHGYEGGTDREAGFAMIALTCAFIFIFAITWAPGVFVVVSETYPLRIRSKGMALATAANWIWGFLIAFFTPIITSHIKFGYGFVFFGFTIMALFFVYFMVPETENLTLEEIDTLYKFYKPMHAFETRSDADYANKLKMYESTSKPDYSHRPKPTPDYGFESPF